MNTEVRNITAALSRAELQEARAELLKATMVQSAYTPVSGEREHFLHTLVSVKFQQCGSNKFKTRDIVAG